MTEHFVRPVLEEPAISALLLQALGRRPADVVDLGGTMSLNLHVVDEGLVVRVHPIGVPVARVFAEQALREHIRADGLHAARTIAVDGAPCADFQGHIVEVETFVEALRADPSPAAYEWLFGAMGRLHRSLERVAVHVPAPPIATWGPPDVVVGGLTDTSVRVRTDRDASDLAARATSLAEILAAQWIAEHDLPNQVIHGDIRLANVGQVAVSGEPAFFDFGFAARRPRVFDLAYALSWIVLRPDDSGDASTFDWGWADSGLVGAYEATAGVALTSLERRALGPYLASVPLYLASIAGTTPDPASRIEAERPFLAIAEWVLRHPGLLA